ncbi:uncharacterized protein LOC115759558 isoform X1 [Drosophila novamexicana]|uniref:uncharacterized protein LOC115759558 isoform X1 n=1 Tax=Drosophila novamexicana TaxID=47314 RepID=UPI0011E5E4F7|nr:uncharacterized protein LOC115759558 isoform X1 [Drosophila novamexicana]XP_030556382.1 uncharacterized protein LOC115759558 isoform X1 [Drosophila novamexicana]
MATNSNNSSSNAMTTPAESLESRDEVDFIAARHNNNNDYEDFRSANGVVISAKGSSTTATATVTPNNQPNVTNNNHNNNSNSNNNTLKKSKERRTLFSFGSKKPSSGTITNPANASAATPIPASSSLLLPPKPAVPIGTPPRQHKFVKSSSIARLLGNTYNARKFEREEQKRLANEASGKFHTFSGRRRGPERPYLERFKRMSKEDGDIAGGDETVQVTNVVTLTTDSRDLQYGSRREHVGRAEDQLSAKAMRTLTRGLGKLWWKRTHSVDISTPDPEYKVSYLGNVLTGWAKAGEGCVEKQLNTLWRNYTQHTKPDVIMRVKVCASGLKATTRQHGLTEYWSNRITYCCAPKNYPRVFCWIYRHEGRKLKHELRCHAVLCSKEKIAQDICETLRDNLESALREFKREKILKQNARLSLANAVYDNPSLPRRKIMLSVGGNNYRPPLERSKSAPKLMAIEEAIGEEEGDEIEDTNEPEMMPCCQRDSLYPAMTLGRRRCRRGHSIRRTGKIQAAATCCSHQLEPMPEPELPATSIDSITATAVASNNDGSDSDEFEKLLKFEPTLSNELLPYFDMQLHKNSSQSLGSLAELPVDPTELDEGDEAEPLSLLPTINSDPSADPQADFDSDDVVHLRRSGVCSDGEEDFLDDADDHYFRQAAMLTMLHRSSMRKRNSEQASLQYRHQPQSSISSNASSSTTASGIAQAGAAGAQQCLASPDSDEGSISSGCETASTVTNANQEEYNKSQGSNVQQQVLEQMLIYQRLEESKRRQQLRHNSDATNYSSSSSITLKLNSSSPAESVSCLEVSDPKQPADAASVSDDDSECSDESGYVEFQEKERVQANAGVVGVPAPVKPQLPPKPAPRRSLSLGATASTGTPV